jgi:uncharacterized protein (DUF2252 family)
MPRRAHADFAVPERDPVAILERQHASRLPDLVPVRVGRMLQSPFAFYRGAAAVMAFDLSGARVTGCRVLACGDAHLANFGLFASPERRVLFDLTDFDEAYPGPWEWDVKRLAASAWISGRTNSHTEEQCRTAATAAVRAYRQTLALLFDLPALERFYYQAETGRFEDSHGAAGRRLQAAEHRARSRTSEQVLAHLATVTEGGVPRIVDQPPIVTHPERQDRQLMAQLFSSYRCSLRPDAALLLSQFELVDHARRTVGVGSVGTRCSLLLLQGPAAEPLFLQAKEAQPSVLQTFGKASVPAGTVTDSLLGRGQGYRVVAAQRILQAQSDPFLGWLTGVTAEDGTKHDYYLRQFRDMKVAVQPERLTPPLAARYLDMCGSLLARAHSQSPGSAYISGYLGQADTFDAAIARWAQQYADRNERDHAALAAAVRTGRLPAETGL